MIRPSIWNSKAPLRHRGFDGRFLRYRRFVETHFQRAAEIAQIRSAEFKEYVLGSYSVSVLVNAANPLSNLTSNQVASLFTGKVQNWKKVGGSDAPGHPFARDPVSGIYLGFNELAIGFQDYGTNVQYFTNYTQIAEAVAKDSNDIG